MTTTNTTITLTGATIAQGGRCQFSVPLINAPVGTFVNSTGAVSAGNAGTGNFASATLVVGTPPLIPTLSPSMIALLAAMLFSATYYFMRKRRQ